MTHVEELLAVETKVWVSDKSEPKRERRGRLRAAVGLPSCSSDIYLQVVEVLLAIPARGADLHGAASRKSGIPLSEEIQESEDAVGRVEM